MAFPSEEMEWLNSGIHRHPTSSSWLTNIPAAQSSNDDDASAKAMDWQTKAHILSHPLFEQLLSAHVSCLRIATPVDQLPRIDAQLAQSHQVLAKYSPLPHANFTLHADLQQFMVTIFRFWIHFYVVNVLSVDCSSSCMHLLCLLLA